ncbi:monocarboxylate transporter 4-like [Gigantopelta aegis]|uniref:monocarboxylate transporter 4-like n=1 Tax=Gigantopelta aegis TaxID=1735272 RepID=UPI001B88D4E5|nr:monocarboxylate transporter 4-like [Gigantopelta aegis]XP_041373324.1 monocarboxylate transporter 4-like [Gigantopelta aegis]XP_041373325.1 monocarboxylate transporter 4-like [Gigantopelta aegis]
MTRAKDVDDDIKKPTADDDDDCCYRSVRSGPQDGGWGWVVVLASLTCNIIVDGLCFTSSLSKAHFVKHFGASEVQGGFVSSLLAGCYLTVGPLVSALASRYGCRRVTICGAILSSVAFLVSTQSSSIEMLILTYSIMGGIGFGMIYLPAIVTVGYWFDKKRGFATGIAVCGSGIGTFIFAPLGEYLLEEYGWKGCNVLMAGIILNCVVCGAVFRPLDKKKPRRDYHEEIVVQRGSIMKALIEEKKRQRTISNGSLDNCIITKDNRLIKIDPALFECRGGRHNSFIAKFKESLGFSTKSLNNSKQSLVIPHIVISPSNGSSSTVNSSPIYKPSVKSSTQTMMTLSSTNDKCSTLPNGAGLHNIGLQNIGLPNREIQNGGLQNGHVPLLNESGEQVQKARSLNTLPQGDPWLRLSQENSLNTRSFSCQGVHHINGVGPPTGAGASVISIQVVPTDSRSSMRQRHRAGGSSRSLYSTMGTRSMPASIVGASVMCIPQYDASVESLELERNRSTIVKVLLFLKDMFDFRLIKSPMFALLLFASILSMLGFFIPFVFIGIKADEIGIGGTHSAFLLSIIGTTNTIGRIICGWIADRPWADPLVLNNLALVAAGVFTMLCPFCETFLSLALYAAAFGFCVAVFVSLRSILLVDLLGLDMLTKSFGILILFQGVASMAGSPLAGRLLESTGDVAACFYMAGSLIALSGILSCPLRHLKRWELGKRPDPLPEEMPINETLKVEQFETTM